MRKKTRTFLTMLLSLALVSSVITVFPEQAYASSDDMRLYAIYLTINSGENPDAEDEQEYGDAVLMESDGEYLLMDTGAEYVSKSVINYLKKVIPEDATLNVYISHIHLDHFNALPAIAKEFNIGTVYLPDPDTIGTQYPAGSGGTRPMINYYLLDKAPELEDRIEPINAGDTFSVGKVSATVLGPVGSYNLSSFKDDKYGKQEGHYLNNYSLTTMFTTPGGVRFLTTGDIESQEEAKLASRYGGALKADILKLAHHGLKPFNSETFISKVKPTFAFAENMGYAESTKDDSGNTVQRFNTPVKTVQKYGMQYMVANEKASLGISVTGNKISLYRDKNNDGNLDLSEKLVKWVRVAGIAPVSQKKFTGKDNFYIDPDSGKPYTGIKKIGKKTYLFSSGGALQKAYYKGTTYRHYRTYGKRLRYFSTPDSNGVAYMAIGPKKIGKNYFFFEPKTGYRFKAKKGTGGTKFKKVKYGKYYYAVSIKNGLIKKNTTIKLGKTKYKANKKGRLKKVKK